MSQALSPSRGSQGAPDEGNKGMVEATNVKEGSCPSAFVSPMKKKMQRKKVAILVADGFEEVELMKPRAALEKGGFQTEIVSPNRAKVKGMVHDRAGKVLSVDVPLSRAKPSNYEALLLPGGVMNPDALRQEKKAVRFVRDFFTNGKPVAAICHGPIMLIEARVLKGRTVTSYPSIKTDIENAGARWVDRTVNVDRGLVTSRKPADIPAFNKQMLRAFA
jgi:protease I